MSQKRSARARWSVFGRRTASSGPGGEPGKETRHICRLTEVGDAQCSAGEWTLPRRQVTMCERRRVVRGSRRWQISAPSSGFANRYLEKDRASTRLPLATRGGPKRAAKTGAGVRSAHETGWDTPKGSVVTGYHKASHKFSCGGKSSFRLSHPAGVGQRGAVPRAGCRIPPLRWHRFLKWCRLGAGMWPLGWHLVGSVAPPSRPLGAPLAPPWRALGATLAPSVDFRQRRPGRPNGADEPSGVALRPPEAGLRTGGAASRRRLRR